MRLILAPTVELVASTVPRVAAMGRRRRWTEAEDAEVRERYPLETAASIAVRLGRSTKSVHLRAGTLGLCSPAPRFSPAEVEEIRRLNARGYGDVEIAAEIGRDRHAVSTHRKRMGLPSNWRGPRFRARIAAKTREVLDAYGLRSMGEMRSAAHRARVLDAGWPQVSRPRQAQILDLLHREGPKTRREIAEGIGLRWAGKATFKCDDPGGTHLAYLIRLGLVANLGKIRRRPGKGRSQHVYTLTLNAERSLPDGR